MAFKEIPELDLSLLDYNSPNTYDTRWIWKTPDNKFYYNTGACHRYLIMQRGQGKTLYLALCLGHFKDEDIRKYTDWLFTDDFPYFRLSAVENVQFHERNNRRVAVSFDTTDKTDASALGGLAIASRLPFEQGGMFAMWLELVSRGYTKRAAFILCHLVAYGFTRKPASYDRAVGVDRSKLMFLTTGLTHALFLPPSLEDISAFIKDKPHRKMDNPLARAKDYAQVAAIFNTGISLNFEWSKLIKKDEKKPPKPQFFRKFHENVTRHSRTTQFVPANTSLDEYLTVINRTLDKEGLQYRV